MDKRYLLCTQCKSLNRIPLERIADGPRCGKCKSQLSPEPVQSVDLQALEQAVAFSPIPVVVDFWAPWCGPCLAFGPTFKARAEKNSTSALYLKIDTEEHPAASQRFGIRGIPTLIFFSGGQEKGRKSGALPPPALDAWLQQQGVV